MQQHENKPPKENSVYDSPILITAPLDLSAGMILEQLNYWTAMMDHQVRSVHGDGAF